MGKQFKDKIKEIINGQTTGGFDRFIIGEMGFSFSDNGKSDKEIRHKALLEFRKRTGRYNIATMPTMRRWFGNSYRCPTREQIYKICFALGLDKKKTSEYLTIGIGETDFQINDYKELIFLYGIENKLTYEECEEMINYFEKSFEHGIYVDCDFATHELYNEYHVSMNKSKEDFLKWMIANKEKFKGYSNTIIKYINLLKNSVLQEIRMESQKRLEDVLNVTGYYSWRKENNDPAKDEPALIEMFVRDNSGNHHIVSEFYCKSILELTKIVYKSNESNRKMLDAVYSSWENVKVKRRINNDDVLYVMGDKYISDLLHMPLWKERMIKCSIALNVLADKTESDDCPEWIVELCENTIGKKIKNGTVPEAENMINDYVKENCRRCILLHRNDLLPMILYIAQNKYLREKDSYNKEEALQMFISMADMILGACFMEPVNKKFELDSLLLECFQKEDMYSYSDLLEIYFEEYKKTNNSI